MSDFGHFYKVFLFKDGGSPAERATRCAIAINRMIQQYGVTTKDGQRPRAIPKEIYQHKGRGEQWLGWRISFLYDKSFDHLFTDDVLIQLMS